MHSNRVVFFIDDKKDCKDYCKFKGCLCELEGKLDEKSIQEVFEIFGGRSVKFPTRLYSVEYLEIFIKKRLIAGSSDKELIKDVMDIFSYCEETARKKINMVKKNS